MSDYLKERRKKEKVWVGKTRKDLKRKSTPYEKIVFEFLLRNGFSNVIKQYPIKVKGHRYFLDLYIRSRKVAIEVDGGYHFTESQMTCDKEREENLRTKGIQTLRIVNSDVLNLDKLYDLLDRILMLNINL